MMTRALVATLIALPLGCTAILAADDLTFRDSTSGSGGGAGAGGGLASSSVTGAAGASASSSGSGGSGGGSPCSPLVSTMAPDALWNVQLGESNDDAGRSVAIAGTGLALAGLKRDNWTSPCPPLNSNGGNDAFYAQFDSAGTCSQLLALGGSGEDVAHSVAASGLSLIAVAGQTQNASTDFPGLGSGRHAFVANVGTASWKLAFNGSNESDALGVAIAPNNDIVVTGQFASDIDFGCIANGMGGMLMNVGAGANVFVAKRGQDSTCIWSRAFGDMAPQVGSPDARGNGVVTDAAGNIFVAGSFDGALEFPGAATLTTSPTSAINVFVVKLDAQGNPVWSTQGATADTAQTAVTDAIAFDPLDNSVLVIGSFQTSLDFGMPCNPLTTGAADAVFVVKLDAMTGTCIWARDFGTAGTGYGNSIAVDACGNVLVVGSFTGDIDFGGGPLSSANAYDMFLAKLDKAGNHVWSQRYGGNNVQIGLGIAAFPNGNIAVTGSFWGTINFGKGDLTAISPTSDVFLAVFPPQ